MHTNRPGNNNSKSNEQTQHRLAKSSDVFSTTFRNLIHPFGMIRSLIFQIKFVFIRIVFCCCFCSPGDMRKKKYIRSVYKIFKMYVRRKYYTIVVNAAIEILWNSINGRKTARGGSGHSIFFFFLYT